jgi:arsenate reductase
MFGLAAASISTKVRPGWHLGLAEGIATLGLLLVVFALARSGRTRAAPGAVGAYIGAAYFFTASTAFANPAVTVARMLSNTFAGIAPQSVPRFLAGQLAGAAGALLLIRLLYPDVAGCARDVVMPTKVA